MNSLVEELWDEWSAYPAEESPHAEGECAGLLSGFLSERGDPLRIGTTRLWAVCLLIRLWRKTRWAKQTSSPSPASRTMCMCRYSVS